MAELLEIEHTLQDARLTEDGRFALMGVSQAPHHILDPETWQPASQTFHRLDARPEQAASLHRH